jgi:hypothetical protein
VVVGALLNGLLTARWSPSELANAVEWLWWLGIIATASAILALGMAVYPRVRRAGPKPTAVAYYGDVMELSRDELAGALAGSTDHSVQRLVDQVYQVSLIVTRKYSYIRYAMRALGVGALLCTLSVLSNVTLGP